MISRLYWPLTHFQYRLESLLGLTELIRFVRQKISPWFSLILHTVKAIVKILQEDNAKTTESYRVDQNITSFTKKHNIPILKSLFFPWRTILYQIFWILAPKSFNFSTFDSFAPLFQPLRGLNTKLIRPINLWTK